MHELIPAAARRAVKKPFELQLRLAGKALEALPWMPFLPPKENFETEFFAGRVALVGDSCATSSFLAEATAETLDSHGVIDHAGRVVLRPILPAHNTLGADNKKPVKAASQLAEVLTEQFGVEVDGADELSREVRRMTPGRHDGRSLTELLDRDCESPQIGIIPAFIGHEVLRTSRHTNIYQTLNAGGAVELHQEPRLGVVQDDWIPILGRP